MLSELGSSRIIHMASYNASLSVPVAFPFDTPDYWLKWKRRFEQYHLASGLLKESEERLYCTALAKKPKTF